MLTSTSSQEFQSSQENVYSRTTLPKIPKIKKAPAELLQTIDENDKIDYFDILNRIHNSFVDKKDTLLAHSLTRIQLINNRVSENTYETYKRERKSNEETNSKREKRKAAKFTERDLFLLYYDEDKATDTAKNGLECEEAEFNYLGDSKLGIHFSKNLDALLKHQYMKFKQRKELYCIIVKAFYDPAKLFQIELRKDNSSTGASMDHDGHIPYMPLDKLSAAKPVLTQYNDSLIFLYDVDQETFEYMKKPRNLLPYAILKYEYKQDRQLLKNIKNTIQAPISTIVNTRNAFTNRNRYFNQINNTTNTNIIDTKNEIQIINNKSSTITSNRFVESDYIPLFNESKPEQQSQQQQQQTSTANTSTYDSYIERLRKQQENRLTQQQQTLSKLEEFDACRLVKNFRPKTPPPLVVTTISHADTEKTSIYSDDDEEIDELQLLEEYFLEYADRFNECKEKLPKWRIIYERTGNVDHIFRAGRRMECKLKDVKQMKFKYLDDEKTKLSVNNVTNKFILDYESKRIKKNNDLALANVSNDDKTSSINKTDENNSTNNIIRLRFDESSYVSVDFSHIPSSIDLNKQVAIKTEKIKIDPNKVVVDKTTQLKKPSDNNNNNDNNNKNNNNKPKTNQQLVKKDSIDKSKLIFSTDQQQQQAKIITNKIKEEKKDITTSLKPKALPSKDILEKFKAKMAAQQSDKNKTSTINTPTATTETEASKKQTTLTTTTANIKTSSSSTSLSSENTSLERRLLGIDKTKPVIKQEPTVPKESQLKTNILLEPTTRSNNIKEDMKKLLEKYRKEKASKEENKKLDTKNKNLIDSIKSTDEMMKKKKSFWDPDSDTEYDKLRNPSRVQQIINNDDEDEDDIVIVSKQNLNLPPVQYSKQFYDSNINGFEAELRKFSPAYVSSCSSSPLNNNLSISNNTVTTVTKSPIKSRYKQSQQLQHQQQQSRRLNNFRLNNRQRYIHHIVVSNINSFDPFVNQFDVDGLKQLKSKSQNNLNSPSLTGSSFNLNVIEIHSGGFRCIEEHSFQRTASYLRRTKSFDTNKMNDSNRYESNVSNNRKISLNDYVNVRKSTTTSISTVTSTAPTTSVVTTQAVSSNAKELIKNEPVSPLREQTCSQPLRQSIENTVLPPFNQKAQQLPSLSLIDELKKRINKKEDKSLYSNQRLIKEDDLYDDDELKRLQSEHSKLKRSHHYHHHYKKRDKYKKKLKLDANNLENDSSSDDEEDDDVSDSISSFSSASLSSELLLDNDDNLNLSSSSISSFSSFDSSESSTESNKKKHKKSKHARKRKLSSPSDDGELDSTQKSRKKSKKYPKSKYKSNKRKHQNNQMETSQISLTNLNEKSNQTNTNSNTNSKFLTNDDDYSIGDLNIDVFDRDLSNNVKNESTDKTLESTAIKTSEPVSSNIDSNKDLDKTLIEHTDSIKQTENYDNFYSEYDIDDAAVLFNTTLPSTSTITEVVFKSEPKSPVKRKDTKHTSPSPQVSQKSQVESIKSKQSSPTTSQQSLPSTSHQNTQSPIMNNPNLITTPKTAPTQPTQSRFHHHKQNFYTPNLAPNRPPIRPQNINNSNKMNYNSNKQGHVNRSYNNSNNNNNNMNQILPNIPTGLDMTSKIIPNMNYMQTNAYGDHLNYQQNMYSSYTSFDDFEYQNSSNSNYSYSQLNNYQYLNQTNNNYSAWSTNKDKFYNSNNNFNNNNYNTNYNQQRNYSRNFSNNNNNTNRMNTNNPRQYCNQHSRSNNNVNYSNAPTNNNKRAQNHDQEDGEIVD